MSKDIKKALEHCIEWNCADCPNREELGSGETVCRGRLLPEVLEYVADIETKLAESEKSKESYRLQNEDHHLKLLQFYSRLGVEAFGADIHEKALETLMIMKEQIAEKDAEIKQLKLDLGMFRSVNEFLNGYGIEKAREVLLQTEKTKQQDKISFAVEQLEKAKGLIANHIQELWTCENDDIDLVLYEEIDKQINELKGKAERS